MSDLESELPLPLYAAVIAALGEGYARSEILEHEGLSEDAWEAGEAGWVERLGDSAEGDLSLFDEFERALAARRLCFARRVPPLDDDLAAFMAFQRHLAAAEQPLVWLAQRGLHLGDWVRLQERWAERLTHDPEVRTQAGAFLSSRETPALPDVQPAARTLPAPWRPRPGSPAILASGELVAGDPGDSIEWGLAAIRGPRPARSLAARPGAAPHLVAPAPRSAGPAEVAAPFTSLPARPTFMHAPTNAPAPRASLDGPAHAVEIRYPAVEPSFDATQTLAPGPLMLVERPALPFAPDAPAVSMAQDAPSDASLTLAPGLMLVERPALPFAPDAPAVSMAQDALIDATQTLAPGLLPLVEQPALPFATGTPAAMPPATGPSARLTIEQYAALCAELAVMPAASEATFQRYCLTSLRERLSVDLAWQERLRRNEAERRTWSVLYQRYHAHFTHALEGRKPG